MADIHFGTDGWRAVIAKDFTFETVGLVAKAVADTMKQELPDIETVFISSVTNTGIQELKDRIWKKLN